MHLTIYAVQSIFGGVQIKTTDDFAEWFGALDDVTAESVAAAIDVVERLGSDRAAPGSGELLLWYEHPLSSDFLRPYSFAAELETWGPFREYVGRVLERLESPRFVARVMRLPLRDAETVLELVERIRRRVRPQLAWAVALRRLRQKGTLEDAADALAEIRRLYLAALGAAGFEVADVPAHSLALRELPRRSPAPGFRLLYGVDAGRDLALFVLGERLGRAFYGDSVRRAESAWKQFLGGGLPADALRLGR
jgi:hypothetical protein